MKKIITLALLALSALSAHAQFWVGGSMTVNRSKEDNSTAESIDRTTTFAFKLMPEVGYHLTDKVALAISAGYMHTYMHDVNDDVPYDGTQSSDNYYLTPYVRYYFNNGRLRLFTNGEIPFSSDDHGTNIGLALRPGVEFEVCPRMGLLCYVGALSYNHSSHGNYSRNTFDFRLSDQIYLGVYFNL